MFSSPITLDLEVQPVDVVSDRCHDALCEYVLFAPVPVLPEPHVFFYDSKASFCLDTSVDTKQCTVIACDTFKAGFLVCFHRL